MIFQLWNTSLSQIESMVVLVMSFGPFRMCLVSCTHSIHGQHSISSYNITLGHYEFDNEDFLKRLSEDYQWMDGNGNVNTENPLPPFELQFIQAGSRVDWSWYTFEDGLSCEVNWLDPEPSCESCDYETYARGSCVELNVAWIQISTEDIMNLPMKRSTVAFVKSSSVTFTILTD